MEEDVHTTPNISFSSPDANGTSKPQCAVTIENKQLRKWMIKNMITENSMNELLLILKGGFSVDNVAKNAKKLVEVDKDLFQEIVSGSSLILMTIMSKIFLSL